MFRVHLSHILAFLLSFGLLVTGCGFHSGFQTTKISLKSPEVTATHGIEPMVLPSTKRTAIPVPTNIPKSTATLTLILTNTLSSSISTWTPLPTFLPKEASALIEELFRSNANCRLPCWWGYTPGKTTWNEAQRTLERFTEIDVSTSLLDNSVLVAESAFRLPPPLSNAEGERLVNFYIVKSGVIEIIEAYLPIKGVDKYRISNVLAMYGQPEEIWITTYRNFYCNEGNCSLPFGVVLFYPEKGFLVNYWASDIRTYNDKVLGCFMNDASTFIGLWSPVNVMNFSQAKKEFRFDSYDLFLPLDQATEMTIETYYKKFVKEEATCIETPANLWPEQ